MALAPEKRIRYEFDKSARSPNNLVTNEGHVLNDREVRVFMPKHAHFYIESLVMIDRSTGNVVPRSSYHFDEDSETIAMLTGHGAACLVVITDKTVGKNISISYQAVGGQFTGVDVVKLQKKLLELNLSNRPISWQNIFNKPKAFNPAEHFHPIWQTFGYQNLVYVIERLVQATLVGDEQSHTVIWEAINQMKVKLDQFGDNFNQEFNDFKRATQMKMQEVDAKLMNTYTKKEIDDKDKVLRDLINSHINARGNVHGLKASDINTYDKPQIDRLLEAIKTSIKNIDAYTRPQVDTKIAGLNQSITNLTNNFNTTKQNLNNNYYTKAETDAKDRTDKDYADTLRLLVEKTITKALFGTYVAPRGQLTSKDGTKYTLEEDVITRAVTNNLGRNLKLVEGVIPISTEPYNQLRWNKNGLYYGTSPDAVTGNLFVDPDEGVDEPCTFENKRGTREKPLATISYALTQGPSDVTRYINIKEGKTHFIGKEPDPVVVDAHTNNPKFSYDNWKRRYPHHADNQTATFRGGRVYISPYGPRIDALLNEIKGYDIRAKFSEESYYDRIRDIGTTIWFRGLNFAALGHGGRRALTTYCMGINPKAEVNFRWMNIKHGDYSAPAYNQIKELVRTGRNYFSSSMLWGWDTNADVSFQSCTFDTGRPFDTETGAKMYVVLCAPDSGIQKISFTNVRMVRKYFGGENPLFNLNKAVGCSFLVNNNPGFIDLSLISSGGHTPGISYIIGLEHLNGLFTKTSSNLVIPKADLLNTNKAGSPSGTRPAEIEVRNGIVYALFHNGSALERIQIYPARWAS